MHCQNVHKPGCDREATNSVPMFMGSVWMCPRCSIEHSDTRPPAGAPFMWSAPDPQEWERLDRETWGLVG